MVDIIVMKHKSLKIDFLFLDLNTCSRCMETEHALDEAVEELSKPLRSLGYDLQVNKINVTTVAMAETYKFMSSPTIRVEGFDILGEIAENACDACSDISGSATSCRVFVYDGRTYNDPPKAMIMDGILKVLYGSDGQRGLAPNEEPYVLPKNLESFFDSKNDRCCGDEVIV